MVTRETRKLGKQQYGDMVALVKRVIAEWDPYALLASGSPHDEFDSEVASIVAQFPRIKSATDAAHVISRVFASSFVPTNFTPESCAQVGKQLFAAFRANGFVA